MPSAVVRVNISVDSSTRAATVRNNLQTYLSGVLVLSTIRALRVVSPWHNNRHLVDGVIEFVTDGDADAFVNRCATEWTTGPRAANCIAGESMAIRSQRLDSPGRDVVARQAVK